MSSNNGLKIKKSIRKRIPKDRLTEIRIMYRLVKEAVNDMMRTGLIINVAIIMTMCAILTIFGVFFRFSLSISSFSKELGKVLEVSVYLKDGANMDFAAKQIQEYPHVIKVTGIPKQDSWNSLKKELSLPDLANPLPDTLRVSVDSTKNVEDICVKLKAASFVEDISYASDLAEKINMANSIISHLIVLIVVAIAVLTITIINNTILLVIQSRKDEIEIMRLMGVSNWYIRFPLLLQGAFYGFTGALLSVPLIFLVHRSLLNLHKFFYIPGTSYSLNLVIMTVFIIGIVFCCGGSYWCIKKHLQV
ncbi:permease-like cell division protein FtsX [bacterium]|nr:permease-like cell division protein FtsX [bacterium]